MADGLQAGFLSQLASESVLILRSALDAGTRARLAETQSLVDALIAGAIAGEANAASPCLTGRYTLPIDLFGAEVADGITKPLIEMIAGNRAFRKTIYGGLFVSYPALSRAVDFHWHSDGHFDGLDEAGVNFWIPLRDCGADAPGIAFTRASESRLNDLRALPQQTGAVSGFTSVNWPAVTDADIQQSFGPVETPCFELGDVLVFTSACLHRTHFPANAKIGRAALIVRYSLTDSPSLAHVSTDPTRPV